MFIVLFVSLHLTLQSAGTLHLLLSMLLLKSMMISKLNSSLKITGSILIVQEAPEDAPPVREDMEIQIEVLEEYYHGSAHYWMLMGETCPTFGLVGAVCGLILALQLLDDPKAMAAGISGAFTATVTGIFGAYALFGPLGQKINAKSKDIVQEKVLIVEGVVSIANGDNPRNLEEKLLGFIKPGEPKISQFE